MTKNVNIMRLLRYMALYVLCVGAFMAGVAARRRLDDPGGPRHIPNDNRMHSSGYLGDHRQNPTEHARMHAEKYGVIHEEPHEAARKGRPHGQPYQGHTGL